jgi:hypothetical protein
VKPHLLRGLIAPLLILSAIVAGLTGQAHAQAADDGDGDGIEDSLEDTLATQFFPWVWFDSGEDAGCTDPAKDSNPGTALARVRPHPGDPGKIAILYTVLYRQDCGDWFGGSHSGDVEPFALTLTPQADCPTGYAAFALKTTAHEGTAFEHTDERLLGNDCNWGRAAGGSPQVARIYSAENKHGNYASLDSCESGAAGNDHCSESFTLPYTVFNVGEDGARRIDELSAQQFPGEYAWTPEPFSGGIGSGGDAGMVRTKLVSDGLLARAN